jgi:hypothetical protein
MKLALLTDEFYLARNRDDIRPSKHPIGEINGFRILPIAES